jgi:hypothetical protein
MTTTSADLPRQTGSGPRHLGLALALISMAQLMVVLDATIANITIPYISADLDFSDTTRTWIVTGYALTFGGLLLLGGRLGDLYGRRRIFMVGVLIFALASLLGGVAFNQETLLAARGLQGVGAALASPTALALITTRSGEPWVWARGPGRPESPRRLVHAAVADRRGHGPGGPSARAAAVPRRHRPVAAAAVQRPRHPPLGLGRGGGTQLPERNDLRHVRPGAVHVHAHPAGDPGRGARRPPTRPAHEYVPPGTPCDEPAGGWRVHDPRRTTYESLDATAVRARRLAGYPGLWLDQPRGNTDPTRLVLNFAFTHDLAARERDLRETWGGALCVSEAPRTERELLRIQDAAAAAAGRGFLSASSGHGVVRLEVIHDDGSLQARFDEEYGDGVVDVSSALTPADRAVPIVTRSFAQDRPGVRRRHQQGHPTSRGAPSRLSGRSV